MNEDQEVEFMLGKYPGTDEKVMETFVRSRRLIEDGRLVEGERLLELCAEAGLAPAQFAYGLSLQNRIASGASGAFTECLRWLMSAAENGYAQAYYRIARIYLFEESGLQDLDKARHYFIEAIKSGDDEATWEFAQHLQDGTLGPCNKELAATLLKISSERGHLPSIRCLALMYKAGEGVEKDTNEAFRLSLLAAKGGDAYGQLNVGIDYERGTGTVRDLAAAMFWYEKSAEQGVGLAMHNLGACYMNAPPPLQDRAKGIAWFEEAAQQGIGMSMLSLSKVLRNGQGADQDFDAAEYWLKQAIASGDPLVEQELSTEH